MRHSPPALIASLTLFLFTSPPLHAEETGKTVTPENFVRAESDRYFHAMLRNAGGKVNTLFHVRRPTPLDRQTILRMNRDTLYSGAIIDTAGGATVTMPPMPDGRYASIMVLDNDHYATDVFYTPGPHRIKAETRHVALAVRIEVKNPDDPKEIALINSLQDKFRIEATSADPLPPFVWDMASLNLLRNQYERDFQSHKQYAHDWQGKRGEANEKTRHLGAAGAWGLLGARDAVYINYSGGEDTAHCYCATYRVPEHKAFWSITVYGSDGYMKHERNILNQNNVRLNSDGSFTARFGSEAACGPAANRLDTDEGWNYLMRIYRPGASVLSGNYALPETKLCTIPRPASPAE